MKLLCSMFSIIGKNMPYIMKLLQSVPPQRNHRLGVELGVPLYSLNTIVKDHHDDCERVRMEVVQRWLNGNADPNVSLSFLEQVARRLCEL